MAMPSLLRLRDRLAAVRDGSLVSPEPYVAGAPAWHLPVPHLQMVCDIDACDDDLLLAEFMPRR